MAKKTIEQVQKEHTNRWMAIRGVEGTAIGLSNGEPCIIVFSSLKADKLRDMIPSTVEDYPVVIKESGTFQVFEQN